MYRQGSNSPHTEHVPTLRWGCSISAPRASPNSCHCCQRRVALQTSMTTLTSRPQASQLFNYDLWHDHKAMASLPRRSFWHRRRLLQGFLLYFIFISQLLWWWWHLLRCHKYWPPQQASLKVYFSYFITSSVQLSSHLHRDFGRMDLNKHKLDNKWTGGWLTFFFFVYSFNCISTEGSEVGYKRMIAKPLMISKAWSVLRRL